MKKGLIFLLLISACEVMAQTPSTDLNWAKNTTFSDEFNGGRNTNWRDMTGKG